MAELDKAIIEHYSAVLSNIERLCAHKHVYGLIVGIIKANNEINIRHSFYTLLNESYAITQFMGIRRHVKKYNSRHDQKSTYSLIAVLLDILEYAEKEGLHISKEISADTIRLEAYKEKYKIIIDKILPHLDKDVIGTSVGYNIDEINQCIDDLYNCAMHCYSIVYPNNNGYIGYKIPDGDVFADIFINAWVK